MNKTIITLSSVTYAAKAKKLLSHYGIPVKIIKIDSSRSENGCSHGIELNKKDFLETIRLLRENNFYYSIYDNG